MPQQDSGSEFRSNTYSHVQKIGLQEGYEQGNFKCVSNEQI